MGSASENFWVQRQKKRGHFARKSPLRRHSWPIFLDFDAQFSRRRKIRPEQAHLMKLGAKLSELILEITAVLR